MKYALFDKNNMLIGVYDNQIENSVPLSDEEYEKFADDEFSKLVVNDGVVISQKVDASQIKAVNNANILAQIAAIEAKNPRALRDAILRNDITYIKQQDEQITQLRSQLIN